MNLALIVESADRLATEVGKYIELADPPRNEAAKLRRAQTLITSAKLELREVLTGK